MYLEAYTVYVSHMDVAWGGMYSWRAYFTDFLQWSPRIRLVISSRAGGRARVYCLEPTVHLDAEWGVMWFQSGLVIVRCPVLRRFLDELRTAGA